MADDTKNGDGPKSETPDLETQRQDKAAEAIATPPKWLVKKHDAMLRAYIDGAKSIRTLIAKAHVSYPIAKRAIERGWPEFNWAPLPDLVQFSERVAENAVRPIVEAAVEAVEEEKAVKTPEAPVLTKAERQAVAEHVVQVWRNWSEFQGRWNKLSAQALELLTNLLGPLAGAASECDASAFRKAVIVRDQDGATSVELVSDGIGVATAAAKAIGALKELAQATSFVAGGPTERSENGGAGDFTPTAEQLEILAAGGRPEDMTPMQLAAIVEAGKKAANG